MAFVNDQEDGSEPIEQSSDNEDSPGRSTPPCEWIFIAIWYLIFDIKWKDGASLDPIFSRVVIAISVTFLNIISGTS